MLVGHWHLGFELWNNPVLKWEFILFQTLEKIEDMAVSLIREEWLLNPSQKDLKGDDRQESYRSMFSLGEWCSGYES